MVPKRVRVGKRNDGSLELTLRESERESRVSARKVFNCTYSRINQLRLSSGLTAIPLKHELAELALVKVPFPLETIGVTVMCGPFFSLMPFPPRGLHSLSHVRYTPHCEWIDSPSAIYRDPSAMLASLRKAHAIPGNDQRRQPLYAPFEGLRTSRLVLGNQDRAPPKRARRQSTHSFQTRARVAGIRFYPKDPRLTTSTI